MNVAGAAFVVIVQVPRNHTGFHAIYFYLQFSIILNRYNSRKELSLIVYNPNLLQSMAILLLVGTGCGLHSLFSFIEELVSSAFHREYLLNKPKLIFMGVMQDHKCTSIHLMGFVQEMLLSIETHAGIIFSPPKTYVAANSIRKGFQKTQLGGFSASVLSLFYPLILWQFHNGS